MVKNKENDKCEGFRTMNLDTKFKRAVKRLKDGEIRAITLWRDDDFVAKLCSGEAIDEDRLEWMNDCLMMYMKDSYAPYASFDCVEEDK